MFKNILSSLENVNTYGVISIVLFFTFFCGMLIWAFCLKKNYLTSMEALPLDDGTATPSSTSTLKNSSHE